MKHFHLVGIGGAGLSAIARVLLESGQLVSGSDEQETEFTARLRASGMRIFIGHAAQNIAGAELVLVSSAVVSTNPEVVAAVQAGLPVVKRQDFVGGMMAERVGLAIAGTHGKTTTAAVSFARTWLRNAWRWRACLVRRRCKQLMAIWCAVCTH